MGKKKQQRLIAAVDIGGTKIYALIVAKGGAVVGRARRKTRAEAGFEGVMQRVVDLVHEACSDAGARISDLAAVGVGAPSAIGQGGVAVNAPNLGWRGAPLVDALEASLELPVYAENDCNLGTLGEYVAGAGTGARSLVGLFMGTGLGGGIVIEGRLTRGVNRLAAEIGHTIVVVNGRRCGCGHRGCLEAYASKTGIGRRITHEILCEGRESLLAELCEGRYDNIRSGLLAKAYEAGDPVAVEALHEAADYLGYGAGNMITTLGPDVIVLGGGVFEALGPRLIDRVREAARAVTFPPSSFGDTSFKLAGLGDDAIAIGAAAWASKSL